MSPDSGRWARGSAAVLAIVPAAASYGAIPGPSSVTVGPGGGTPGTSENFQLVGRDPLFNRGMNAAATIYSHYIYIGNRTDGSSTCGVGDPRAPGDTCPHPHPGVLIDDIANPADPHMVGEIGPPQEGSVGISSRELRVWCTPGSPGRARGIARLITRPDEFHRFQPGDVLVAHTTTPIWTPLFNIAAAAVTEVGGPFSHAAIVAREFGIPLVNGAVDATRDIADGTFIVVDGSTGIVELPSTTTGPEPAPVASR